MITILTIFLLLLVSWPAISQGNTLENTSTAASSEFNNSTVESKTANATSTLGDVGQSTEDPDASVNQSNNNNPDNTSSTTSSNAAKTRSDFLREDNNDLVDPNNFNGQVRPGPVRKKEQVSTEDNRCAAPIYYVILIMMVSLLLLAEIVSIVVMLEQRTKLKKIRATNSQLEATASPQPSNVDQCETDQKTQASLSQTQSSVTATAAAESPHAAAVATETEQKDKTNMKSEEQTDEDILKNNEAPALAQGEPHEQHKSDEKQHEKSEELSFDEDKNEEAPKE